VSNWQYTMTKESITLILNGDTHTIRRGASNFEELRTAILNENEADIEQLLSPGHQVARWFGDGFQFISGVIWFEDQRIDSRLSERMIKMASNNENPSALMKFWRRLQNNPSMRSVDQLYGFLNNRGIPIDPEGYFLAYKAVNRDYKDFHTGRIDNSIGCTLAMPRNRISDDPNEPCHYGFHVGALEYASSFGTSDRRILICRVDPADVVCVPYDASQQKMRVCRYTVVREHTSDRFLSDTYDHNMTSAPELSVPAPAEAIPPPAPAEAIPAPAPAIPAKATQAKAKAPAKATQAPAKATQVKATPAPAKATPGRVQFEYMGADAMSTYSFDDLRAYARSLKIKKVSVIPGGKKALIEAILAALAR
jgi:hypothetical protein